MKVIKFGGSSLASATQLEKVLNIVKSDPERRFVVVSAPGKRNDEDTKVTDALIKYYKHYTKGADVKADQEWIINRYQAMVDELGFKSTEMAKIAKSINDLATLPIEDNDFLYDTFLAAGEDNNAKLIAEYFRNNGIEARYVHPRQAGILSQANQEMLVSFQELMTSWKSFVNQMRFLLSLVSSVLPLIIKFVLSHVEALISLVLSLQLELRQIYMKTSQM